MDLDIHISDTKKKGKIDAEYEIETIGMNLMAVLYSLPFLY